MQWGDIIWYSVAIGGGLLGARSIVNSFVDYLDDTVSEFFADRREDTRQQVADARYAVTPWGDIAWPVDARCPVDFVDGKTGAEVFDRAGERAKSGTGLRGNDIQVPGIQFGNQTSLQTRRQNRAGQVR